jgi:hypothetical protein
MGVDRRLEDRVSELENLVSRLVDRLPANPIGYVVRAVEVTLTQELPSGNTATATVNLGPVRGTITVNGKYVPGGDKVVNGSQGLAIEIEPNVWYFFLTYCTVVVPI